MTIEGRVWLFGDGIDTDIIIPARYLVLPIDEMKSRAMEPLRPEFAAAVAPGDIIIAGRNFGCGSSREQAPAVLKALGVVAIIAESFARIFYRNAINLGISVVEAPGCTEAVKEGQRVSVDLSAGTVTIEGTGVELTASPLPDFLLQVIVDGGLIPHLRTRKARRS
jgi:3-isopropylmalate/(R)-2-methylmalate dehydratase small subunit